MTVMTRIAVLTNFFEVAQQLGENPQTLLLRCGLNPALFENPDNRVSSQSIVDVLEEAAHATGCMTFGLRMAESRQLSDLGAMSLLVTPQPTLREALNAILQYRYMLNESLSLYIEEVDKTAVIRVEIITGTLVVSRQAIELVVGVLQRLCAALLGSHWKPRSANFTHSAPDDIAIHRRIFGCKLEFESDFNGIVIMSSYLDIPNPMADRVKVQYAQRYIESLVGESEGSPSGAVLRALYMLLPMHRTNIEQVAQTMGTSVRTLQRRLEEYGETFSTLVNQARHDLAQRYMDNPTYPLNRIADLLGFSSPSSFTRWFISQFGKPPGNWRRERREQASKVQ